MDTVSLIIATYGEKQKWDRFANGALRSVIGQTRMPDEIIRYHGESLHQARNHAAEISTSKYLIFLDADDEIDSMYVEMMLQAEGYLRYPRVRYFNEFDRALTRACTPQIRHLFQGNYMVIGSMMSREDFLHVGGFKDLRAYEDWDLFIRLWLAHEGQPSTLVAGTCYHACQRERGRNQVRNAMELFNQIVNTYTEEAREKGLV